jgi:hypothetical protein
VIAGAETASFLVDADGTPRELHHPTWGVFRRAE